MNADTSGHASDPDDELRLRREEVEQLREALRSRAVIDQAKGILMGRYRISADRAFALLTRVSQDHNHKVRLLAEALVTDVTHDDAGKPGTSIDMGVFDVSRAKDPRGSAS